jgi:hypothetical protein
MSSPQDRRPKSSSADSNRPSDSRATEEAAEVPKTSLLKQNLAVAKRYILLGFAPAISICALAIAVYALTQNQSGDEQLSMSKFKIDGLNLSLSSTKAELEKLKAAVAQANGLQEEVNKKQDERAMKIIQNLTPLQVKLKISPTLEEQLRQAAAASAIAPAVASSVAAASAVASSVAVASAVAPTNTKQTLPQVKVMKEAIEKYNKNN